jgi:ubiquinone/menaquinone biosynthesis C-methylase UbiE
MFGVSDRRKIRKQIEECKLTHAGDVPYYELAERYLDEQWENYIQRYLPLLDLSITLELACGHGRNSNKLRQYAHELHLVDVNESCIDVCRRRFGVTDGQCRFFYHVNDGKSLRDIKSGSISAIFTWDSMVHFDKRVCKLYIKEFARVLRPNGRGFVHHSNYGHVAPGEDWMKNPGWRSNMTDELFAKYSAACGLEVLSQQVIDWSAKEMDCISILQKPY